jgi:hypothetical protein
MFTLIGGEMDGGRGGGTGYWLGLLECLIVVVLSGLAVRRGHCDLSFSVSPTTKDGLASSKYLGERILGSHVTPS